MRGLQCLDNLQKADVQLPTGNPLGPCDPGAPLTPGSPGWPFNKNELFNSALDSTTGCSQTFKKY